MHWQPGAHKATFMCTERPGISIHIMAMPHAAGPVLAWMLRHLQKDSSWTLPCHASRTSCACGLAYVAAYGCISTCMQGVGLLVVLA